jgi:hypothetical protein
MSSNYNQSTFIINFSNNKRKYIENQKSNTNIIFRKNSILEIFAFQYVPCIMASTILAPLNRIKVMLQVKDFIALPKEDISEKGTKAKLSIAQLVKSK